MFMNFSNFILYAVYTKMVVNHKQCIFIIYDSGSRKGTISQQMSKLNELKFISATWPN